MGARARREEGANQWVWNGASGAASTGTRADDSCERRLKGDGDLHECSVELGVMSCNERENESGSHHYSRGRRAIH